MAADNLPPEVIRLLSFHGPVSWWVGGESALARGQAAVAPFEDRVFLFVPLGSPAERALLETNRMVLTARSPTGAYNLRMDGRGVPGLPLARHPRRAELTPWAPEGHSAARTLILSFVPDHIELTRGGPEAETRHAGPTPAGKERPTAQSVWLRACFGGMAAPFALLVALGVWIFLALRGPEYPFRPLALAMAVLAGLLPLAAARLAMLASTFDRWREGRGREGESPLFEEGLLAPATARAVALRLGLLGIALLLAVAMLWEGLLAGLALGLSGVWLLGPAWAVHLSMAEPKR